jgi:hypothetical protein
MLGILNDVPHALLKELGHKTSSVLGCAQFVLDILHQENDEFCFLTEEDTEVLNNASIAARRSSMAALGERSLMMMLRPSKCGTSFGSTSPWIFLSCVVGRSYMHKGAMDVQRISHIQVEAPPKCNKSQANKKYSLSLLSTNLVDNSSF